MATRQYIGARYVPKFDGEWDINNSYDALTIVTKNGNSYTSKKPVGVGVDITDTDYWVLSANFNQQLENYRQIVENVEDKINETIVYVTPEEYGAVGDGVTDDTEAIQKAINNTGVGVGTKVKTVVQFGAKTYLVKAITITRDNVVLKGCKNNDSRGTQTGTILMSARGQTTPMITVTSGSGMGVGGAIEDMMISGGGTRQDYNSAVDRIGLRILNRAEFNLTNVFISEFTQNGLKADDWWDSVVTSLEIRACGKPGSKATAALYLGSDDDSTNSIHFFGLHIEECPLQMCVDDVTSHVQFVGCKFEGGSQHLNYVADNDYAIFIYEGVYAVTFDSCFFSNPEFNTSLLVGNNMTVLTGCQFSTHKHRMIQNYSANSSFGSGIVINSCIFENVNSSVNNFVELGNRGIFSNNMVIYSSTAKPLEIVGENNTITGNMFFSPSSEQAAIDFSGGSNITNANKYIGRKAFSGTNNTGCRDNRTESWRIDASNSPSIDFNAGIVQNVLCNNLVNFTKDNFLNVKDGSIVRLMRNSGDVTLKASMMANNTDYIIEQGKAVTICYISALSKWVIV